ncbi:MAG: hypothetical protein JO112_20065 [Planctomycetes bacterium]|nr:hypothetical protein [Planctomycetota bacterium]
MSTKGLLTILFFFFLIGIGTGIGYAMYTKDPAPAIASIFCGIPALAVTVTLHNDCR